MILQLSRVLKTSYQHIFRNLKLSLASILIMTLTFFVSTIFIVCLYGAGLILSYFESQAAQLTIFFTPDKADKAYMDKIEAEIKNQNIPLSTKFISQKEAYKKFTQYLEEDTPSLSQSIDETKLPASIEIKTEKISDITKIADLVYKERDNSNGKIHRVLYYKNVEDFLTKFIEILRYAGLGLVGFLTFISLLIIWITIGIALSSHADEIEIMQLVGATKIYIELPYIIEGALYGIVGSLVSMGLVVAVFAVVNRWHSIILDFFIGIPLPTITLQQILMGVMIEMLIGAFIGSFGSFLALKSKLK